MNFANAFRHPLGWKLRVKIDPRIAKIKRRQERKWPKKMEASGSVNIGDEPMNEQGK